MSCKPDQFFIQMLELYYKKTRDSSIIVHMLGVMS